MTTTQTKPIHTFAQRFALNQFLSDYEETMSYGDILEQLHGDNYYDDDNDEGIVVWEPYEDEDGGTVADMILSLQEDMDYSLQPLLAAARQALALLNNPDAEALEADLATAALSDALEAFEVSEDTTTAPTTGA